MIISVTGHRPPKLGGYSDEVFGGLVEFASVQLPLLKPPKDDIEKVIVGMALGWDQAVAVACTIVEIPFVAAVPFRGQESKWPRESRQRYADLLALAAEVVIVSEGDYASSKMHKRNYWMVDRADLVVALYDGTPGGTSNCVQYAEKHNKKIVNLWEKWNEYLAR